MLSTERSLVLNLASRINLRDTSELPFIEARDLQRIGDHSFNATYADSSPTLTNVIPNTQRKGKRFHGGIGSRRGIYDQRKAQQLFFEALAKELKLKTWDDWYKITNPDVRRFGGNGILKRYDNSHMKAIMSTFPQREWKPWRFYRVPLGYWKDKDNRRSFFDSLYEDLQLVHWKDWYRVPSREVYQRGGGGMFFEYYGASMSKAIPELYPEHPWETWSFGSYRLPKLFWSQQANTERWMRMVVRRLLQDGYRTSDNISANEIKENGGSSLLAYRNSVGSISESLRRISRELGTEGHDIKLIEGPRRTTKAQTYLNRRLRSVFQLYGQVGGA